MSGHNSSVHVDHQPFRTQNQKKSNNCVLGRPQEPSPEHRTGWAQPGAGGPLLWAADRGLKVLVCGRVSCGNAELVPMILLPLPLKCFITGVCSVGKLTFPLPPAVKCQSAKGFCCHILAILGIFFSCLDLKQVLCMLPQSMKLFVQLLYCVQKSLFP